MNPDPLNVPLLTVTSPTIWPFTNNVPPLIDEPPAYWLKRRVERH